MISQLNRDKLLLLLVEVPHHHRPIIKGVVGDGWGRNANMYARRDSTEQSVVYFSLYCCKRSWWLQQERNDQWWRKERKDFLLILSFLFSFYNTWEKQLRNWIYMRKSIRKKNGQRTFEWMCKHKKQFTNFALIQSDIAGKKRRNFTNISYPTGAA